MNISSANNNANLYRSYQRLASGKKINSAADDAAGLAIAQKLLTQSNGYDVGRRNAGTAQDMSKVAEGALGSINDNLQRMRELSIQASSDLYTDSDRSAIQGEIDQLKQSISDTASQTQFNTMNILDGSSGNLRVVSDSNGSGMDMSMPDATLAALGIDDYDVTKGSDISAIDDALSQINSSRGGLGAVSNRLDNMMNYNSYASMNTMASQSRIEDLDYPKAVSDKKKEELLVNYRLSMQRNQEKIAGGSLRVLGLQ